jgi:DNA repair protein RecO (recombination protein O)
MTTVTHGIVLREAKYKEADKILTVLTPDLGKLTVSARASRKKGGGVSAAAQLLVWSELTLSEYRGRWTLTEGATELEFRSLRRDLDRLALGSYFAELIDVTVPDGQSAPELLSLLLNALYALDALDKPLGLVKAAFELRLMCLSGYEPSLEACAVCGKEPQEPRLHLREGQIHCRSCKLGGGISLPVNPSTLSALRYIARCEGKRLFSFRLDGDSLRELEGVAEAYLLTQMERGFHTLDFYKGLQTGSPVV